MPPYKTPIVGHGSGSALGAAVGRKVRRKPKPKQRTRPVGVFAHPIGPVGVGRRQQHKAARKVEHAQARVPGRTRPPILRKAHTPAQRRVNTRLTRRYLRKTVKERGTPTNVGAQAVVNQIAKYGEPRARKALAIYRQQDIRQQAHRDARAFRRYAVTQARASGVPESAVRKLHAYLKTQPVGHQAKAFRRINRVLTAPTRDDRLLRGNRKPHDGGGSGTPLATVLTHGIHPVAGMSIGAVARAAGTLGGPVVKDTVQLAANAPATVYNLGAAGFEAAHGDTSRAKKLWEGYKNNDPLALAVQGRWGEAAKATAAHPVTAVLDVSGAKAVAGRTGGVLQRAAGHTPKRAPAVLEGTKIELPRPLSRDVITQQRQHAQDAVRVRRAEALDRKADDAASQGHMDKAVEFRQKARQVSPTHVSDAQVRRRMDERVAANEDLRRAMRTEAVHEASKHRIVPRKGGHLVPLVAQNIVRADKGDIKAYIAELDAEYHLGGMTKAQQHTNRLLIRELKAAVDDPKLDLAKIEQAARGFQKDQAKVEGQLVESGLLDASQAEKSRLIPYAVRRMGAHHDGDRLVDANGQALGADRIRAHMEAHGVPEPAYLSQAPNARGAKNYFVNFMPRPTVGGPVRTGEATRLGTYDSHPDILIEQAARARGLVAADRGFKGVVDEFGVRNPEDGKLLTFQTKKQADGFIREMHAMGGRPVRAIRLNPFLGKKSDIESVLEHADQGDLPHTKLVDAMESAVRGDEGPGPWALVHDAAASRLQEHLKLLGPGPGLRGVQKVNQAFRNTVLPLSTKWVTGNVVEAGLRSALARAGPLSWITGRRVLHRVDEIAQMTPADRVAAGLPKNFDEAAALEARLRTTGGGHFSMAERQSVHRDARQFENSALKPMAKALGAAARAPGPKQLGQLWHAYTHAVFGLNTIVERQFQTALAGRFARDVLSDGGMSVSQRAIEQAAKGLTGTNEQVAMARFVDRAYGKYGKFSPTERAMVAYYTPFIAWSLNAAKFVFSVLPKDHPVATAVLASSQRASDEWLKDHGLDMWMKGAAPGWLQGSIPIKGGYVRAGRYTPFGLFNDPASNLASVALPQYMSAIFALNGLDWKGDSLTGFGGEPSQGQKFGAALEAFFGATIPIASQAQQLGTKKGPLGQKLQRQFNPFYPIQQTQQAGTGGSPIDDLIDKHVGGAGTQIPDSVNDQIDKALGR